MTAMREELIQLVESLPEEELPPTLEFVRDRTTAPGTAHEAETPLPSFVGMVKDGEPDWAETSEDWLFTNLRRDAGRTE